MPLVKAEAGMRRRDFIILSGSAVVWPTAALAQQKKTYRIGILSQDLQRGLLETFRDELRKRGHVEGGDVSIELRNAEGHNERLPALVQELLKLNVDVIVAVNTPAVQAAKKATNTVPVVMMRVADPVKSGLVASLARPGGNITGLSFMPDALGPKGVELLHEMLPKMTRMAALYQGNNPGAVIIIDEVQRKGAQIGLNFVRVPVKDGHDLAGAFETAAREKAEALFVMDDGAMTEQRQKILELAAKQKLPVVSIYRDFAKSGGLIAYGPNLDDVYRRAAVYVDKLIKGATAPSLPVEQPVNFYLAVNLKTAKALGLTIPSSILVRADEIIE
jgi:putative ABC transport system substrate-binding protein